MIDFQSSDGQYDEVSETSFESNSNDDNLSNTLSDGSNEPEFKVFDVAREISEYGYRHRSLRRSSSIL